MANKRCRIATAPSAVGALVRQAKAGNRKLVGWSFFDRDRLIDACPDLDADIKALYVNALHVARPWRKTFHPGFPIEGEDAFAPKHTLDKYATLAGYQGTAAFRNATPAKWIKHTLDQLQATKGRYRQRTDQTKRDWHKLLEYNRRLSGPAPHRAEGEQRDGKLARAYEKTRFWVNDGDRRLSFRVGSPRPKPKLEALLRRHKAVTWAYLTTWNPASVELSRAENGARQDALKRNLESDGYEWMSGEGIGDDPSWSPEESLTVLGISRGKAVALGRRFGQLAVVIGRRDEPARLVPCPATPKPGTSRPR